MQSTSDGLDTYYYGKGLISSSSGNYYVQNAHGDVVALTNGAGEITKTYAYDPFGAEKNIDLADNNPFRYCSEYYDKGIDKIYLRARTYDPTMGRFTQQDPYWEISSLANSVAIEQAEKFNVVDIQEKNNDSEQAYGTFAKYAKPIKEKCGVLFEIQDENFTESINKYIYARNNPVSFFDSSGMSATAAIVVGVTAFVVEVALPVTVAVMAKYAKPHDPYARPNQKKQERERKEKKKGDDWIPNPNKKPKPPKKHTPGRDHRKY